MKDKVQLIKDVQLSFNANLRALCLVDVGSWCLFSPFLIIILRLPLAAVHINEMIKTVNYAGKKRCEKEEVKRIENEKR